MTPIVYLHRYQVSWVPENKGRFSLSIKYAQSNKSAIVMTFPSLR